MIKEKLMKNLAKKSFAATLVVAAVGSSVSNEKIQYNKAINQKASLDQMLSQFRSGSIPLPGGLKLELNKSFAQGVGDASCEALMSDAWTACDAMWTTYDHGALKYFNNSLCWLNRGATSNVENVLCHFSKSMGINPDKNALPQTITKEDFGDLALDISVTVSEPTEQFAIDAGYDAKGVVTVDGNQYMVLYWGGTGSASKGFMIEGDVAGLGGDRANYTQWDLTGDVQTVKLISADYPSGTYLSDAGAGDRGDHVIFGSVSYNKTNDAVSTQTVLVSNARGDQDGSWGCFKMYASGTKNGNIVVAKTRDQVSGDNFNNTGHAWTSTALDLTDMDGVNLVDDPATANGTGNLGGADAATMQSNVEAALGIGAGANVFEKSCNDLKTANGGGGVFSTAGTAANFTYGPDDVF